MRIWSESFVLESSASGEVGARASTVERSGGGEVAHIYFSHFGARPRRIDFSVSALPPSCSGTLCPVPQKTKTFLFFPEKKLRRSFVLRIHTKMCCETQIIFAKKVRTFFSPFRAVQLAFSSLVLTVSY